MRKDEKPEVIKKLDEYLRHALPWVEMKREKKKYAVGAFPGKKGMYILVDDNGCWRSVAKFTSPKEGIGFQKFLMGESKK